MYPLSINSRLGVHTTCIDNRISDALSRIDLGVDFSMISGN